MEPRTSPFRSVVLLGMSLLGLGGLLWAWSAGDEAPTADVLVHQRIMAPQDVLIFNGSMALAPGNATVLGALLLASQKGDFDVNVTYQFLGKAFVESIAGHRNEGACGWVYDLNGVRGSRAVDEEFLRDEDHVRWGWDCTG